MEILIMQTRRFVYEIARNVVWNGIFLMKKDGLSLVGNVF